MKLNDCIEYNYYRIITVSILDTENRIGQSSTGESRRPLVCLLIPQKKMTSHFLTSDQLFLINAQYLCIVFWQNRNVHIAVVVLAVTVTVLILVTVNVIIITEINKSNL